MCFCKGWFGTKAGSFSDQVVAWAASHAPCHCDCIFGTLCLELGLVKLQILALVGTGELTMLLASSLSLTSLEPHGAYGASSRSRLKKSKGGILKKRVRP